MKSKIAILLLPFLMVFTFFKENLMKTIIAMFNLNSKSTFSTTLLALMLVLILGGAGFLGSPAWAAEPQYGGSITFLDGYGGRFPPTQWDPAKGVWTVGVYVEPYYETLLATDFVKYGPRGTNEYPSYHSQGAIEELLTGRLAESWSVPDETTLIFKLRQGIMWHAKPGVMKSRELTAEDVVYSFKRNLADAWTWGAHAKVESITATDKYTVEFKLASWIADWYLWFGYASWGAAAIYPKEVVDAGIGDWRNHTGTGMGPFLLEDFVEGSSVTYVRNPNYWDTATINGKEYKIPFVDRMVKTLISDKSAQIAALRTGKIDVHDVVEKKFIPTLQKSSPELKFIGKVAERAWRVGMRQDREPFDDIRVRKALSMAIDRQAIIDTMWGGKGEILNAELHAAMPESYYTPLEKLPESTQENFSYNPDRARQLLAEAGFPNGFKSTIQTIAVEPEKDVAALLVAFWKAIGVDVTIDLHEGASMEGIIRANEHTALTVLPSSVGLPFLTIFGANISQDNLYNTSEINDPELNELYKQAEGTVDKVEQAKLLKKLNHTLLAKTYYAYLPTPFVQLAHWPWIENYYGEVNETCCFSVGQIFARAWVNSDLKAKILGQ